MDKSYRYKQLDSLLRYEDGYTLNELIANLDDDISKRTLRRELDKLQKPPYNMEFVTDMYRGRERLIRYKDVSKSLFDVENDIQSRFDILENALDSLSDIPQYNWMKYLFLNLINNVSFNIESVISFDNNYDLVGMQFIDVLTKAIVHKQPQKLVYRTFRGHKLEVNIHPYHLREFRNRWFLICLTDDKDIISNYALDRIVSVKDVSIPFKSINIDFDEWFEDVIGVSIPDSPVEEILIKVKKERYGYIKTKPLHWSQTEKRDITDENFVFITIKVKVNFELISLLMSFGADIEVVSPDNIRNLIKNITEKMYNLYHDEQ